MLTALIVDLNTSCVLLFRSRPQVFVGQAPWPLGRLFSVQIDDQGHVDNAVEITDWSHAIVGFLSREGELCLLIRGIHDEARTVIIGIPYAADWLRRSLLKGDGKTPLFPELWKPRYK